MAEAIVCGGGPAGLSAAAALKQKGIDAVVLDEREEIGASWKQHYDRLHLHTSRRLSGLYGHPIPRRLGRWVSRDGVVAYLRELAVRHDLEVRLETRVERLVRADGGWNVLTDEGEFRAPAVVVATGYNREPVMPDWPGAADFAGELVHASRYRNAGRYRGRDVLVVGTGNTGAEICVDLWEGGAARVRLSVRTPPTIFPRALLGTPSQAVGIALRHAPTRLADGLVRPLQHVLVGDLKRHGLPVPPYGAYSGFKERDVVPILDVGLIGAVREGKVEVVGAVEGFKGTEVLLAGGERIRPDAVVAATGYRRGLEPLVGHLGLLGENGRPLVHGAKAHPRAPGLYFIGFTNPISGNFRELRIDARRIARTVARDLRDPLRRRRKGLLRQRRQTKPRSASVPRP